MGKLVEILSIEDSAADRLLIETFLMREGRPWRLHFAVDGREGMDFLFPRSEVSVNRPLPDVILLDLNLPCFDGRDILRALRRERRFDGVPVVILSTSSSPEDRRATAQLGANAFYTKPDDLDEYERVLGEIASTWIDRPSAPGTADSEVPAVLPS